MLDVPTPPQAPGAMQAVEIVLEIDQSAGSRVRVKVYLRKKHPESRPNCRVNMCMITRTKCRRAVEGHMNLNWWRSL